jgi:hypothetical protein
MVNTNNMTNEQVIEIGLGILEKELGPVGMIRFIQQFDLGHGDYTRDRNKWLKTENLDDLLQNIKQFKDKIAR